MGNKRGRAYRRWKTFTKYVSKVKDRMGWYVDDPNAPRGHRNPKNWKELDSTEDNYVKMLKKTATKWSSKWEDVENHIKIKKIRQDDRNVIEDGMNE